MTKQGLKIHTLKFWATIHHQFLGKSPISLHTQPKDHHTRAIAWWVIGHIAGKNATAVGIREKSCPGPRKWFARDARDQHNIEKDDGEAQREEAKARQVAVKAALARIDELSEQDDEATKNVAEHLRTHYEARAKSIAAASSDDAADQKVSNRRDAYLNLQQETLKAEHDAIIHLRNRGEINDEVLHRIEPELDLEEERLEG